MYNCVNININFSIYILLYYKYGVKNNGNFAENPFILLEFSMSIKLYRLILIQIITFQLYKQTCMGNKIKHYTIITLLV